jgi:hypothetical protein
MNSLIVEFWSRIFFVLGKISLFDLLRAFSPRFKTYRWVDIYVLVHLGFSFVAIFIVARWPDGIVAWVIVFYGALRVFEINVYQVNVLLFDEYRAQREGEKYAVRGYRRLVLLLLHNYAEIIFWFSCAYIVFADYFVHKWEVGYRTVIGALYTSFIAMSTFGDFNVNPKYTLGAIILLFQSASGLFMTLLSLARFIGVLPKPATLDDRE